MSVATPALPVRAERFWAALLAATLMNLPLGSVYAFSVLLRPIEQELGIPRSALSLSSATNVPSGSMRSKTRARQFACDAARNDYWRRQSSTTDWPEASGFAET